MRRFALLTAMLVLGPVATAAAAPCPPTAPVPELRTATAGGQTVPASGLTVSRGTTPEAFSAQVLGVLDDAIAPGVDLIVIEASSPAIDRVGGIWAGMSGSPVYADDGRLIGAVAYGLSAGPSRIAGVTPADEMLRVLDRPVAGGEPAASPRTVRLPAALRHEVAARPGVSTREAAGGLERLPIPVGVSGLRPARIGPLAQRLAGPGASVVAHRSSAVPPELGDASAIVPGGNFAAALSYGDVSAAGVGTATAVCDGRVLAFGHPFTFRGATSMSAHSATAITVQDDPTLTPFKLANVGGVVGRVDQDRLTALRALLDRAPAPTPITSTVTDTDSGQRRDGATFVNDSADVPGIAQAHLVTNIDRVTDRIGAGHSHVTWTVTGRAGEEPFSLTRGNRFAAGRDPSSPFGPDISVASASELFGQLTALRDNPFARVVVTGVRIDADVAEGYRALRVEGLERREAGAWVPVGRDPVPVRANRPLRLRVRLGSFQGISGSRRVRLTLRVPGLPADTEAQLVVRGGSPAGGGEEEPSDPPAAQSFAELLAELRDAPRNDELIAELHVEADEEPAGAPAATARRQLTDVVTGSASAPVQVVE